MTSNHEIDALIRRALEAEDAAVFDRLGEPDLPALVTDVFSGRLRLYGAMFMAMILGCAIFAVYCAVRFLTTDDVSAMLRWGVGLIVAFLAAQGGKSWYWMQLERLAMTREIKRVELLVAQLAAELRSRS